MEVFKCWDYNIFRMKRQALQYILHIVYETKLFVLAWR